MKANITPLSSKEIQQDFVESIFLQSEVRQFIEKEGLVCIGFVDLKKEERFQYFESWLNENKHAEMSYLENYQNLRKDPSHILPGAKQAILIGFPYYQGDRHSFNTPQHPRVAQYAKFPDYHKVLKKKCESILASILKHHPEEYGRVLVDSAPILERALAEKSLNGGIGKNTMYIHPQYGSYLLLSEIFISFALIKDVSEEKETLSCGTCMRCQNFCPTGALTPYSLDARKCIAYYTIEHRGPIPIEYWKHLKTYIFGCDICQLVCPFNRKVEKVSNLALKLDEFPPLLDVVKMDAAYYERVFGGTPMTRAKRSGLRRNALIAMIVKKDEWVSEAIKCVLNDEDPVLKETVKQIPDYEEWIHEAK